MNILFLTLSNITSLDISNIYTDLLSEFAANGDTIYIASPNERRNRQKTHLIKENNATILRVAIGNIKNTNVIQKGLSTLLLEKDYKSAIKKYLPNIRFDLVLYSTPPVTLCGAIKYLKKRDGAKTYLLLKDIFPQNAVDIGMMKKNGLKGILYNYFRAKEKELYRISDYIGCMSKANVDYILRNNHFVSPEKVEVCPNSIRPLTIEKCDDTTKSIREKYNIPLDKTIFIYGGNLGKPQGIDFLVECLRANRTNESVYFVIAGSGSEFKKLKTLIDTEKLQNVQILAQVPKNDYEMIVNSCDVGLIFLDKRFSIPNFPSRLLSYMQASMAVLAATDVNTDIGEVIEAGKFGFWCESGNVEEFNYKVQQLCNSELREQMGEMARRYLEENYTVKHSYEIIMKHFNLSNYHN